MRTLTTITVLVALCGVAAAQGASKPAAVPKEETKGAPAAPKEETKGAPAAPKEETKGTAAAPKQAQKGGAAATPAAAPEAADAAPSKEAAAPAAGSPRATAPAGADDTAQAPASDAARATPAAETTAATSSTEAQTRSMEESRRALARTRLRMQLARARAVHAREAAEEPEPEPVHGDAGAAIAIGFSADSSFYPDASYDAFDDDDVATRLGFWLAHDVAMLRSDTVLALELGYGHESEEETVLGGVSTQLDTHVAFAGAQLRWVPIDVLQPHARLAAGAAFLDARLRDRNVVYQDGSSGLFDGDLFDSLISPFASLGLGVTLRTPSRLLEDKQGRLASLSAGVMLEGGYTLAMPVDVALDGPGPSARGIALEEPGLGELQRSGPYVRVSLVLRF